MTILKDIKKALGVEENNLGFDDELLMYINGSIAEISQLGVSQYRTLVVDEGTDWPALDNSTLDLIAQPLLLLMVKSNFDPVASETIQKVYKNQIDVSQGRLALEIEEEEANA